VNKVVEKDRLIPVSGVSIKSADDLWARVLSWMEGPVSRTEKTGTTLKSDVSAKGGGKIGIPMVAEGKAEGEVKLGGERQRSTEETYPMVGLPQVIKDIGNSNFTLFVDDFHYIPKDVQKEIGMQIKEAAESGVRICAASVPHRSDDVVRSNTELRGPVTAVDTGRWTQQELEQIALRGFQQLNVDVTVPVMNRLTAEAFGSPQLMRAICLNFCFENKILETLPTQQRIEMNFVALQNVLERTSTLTDFSTMISRLHAGPKLRGHERKEFQFKNGKTGDVYLCVLLAMKADPPLLTLPYDELLNRTRAVCIGESPSGSSVANTLTHMTELAQTVQEAAVIEWDEDVLDIVEPYFLFFLRCSSYLDTVA
jgi:hypothetical protein